MVGTYSAGDFHVISGNGGTVAMPSTPARELLADLLLELNEPGAALKEYEQALRNDPNRFRSIIGRARAAKQLGNIAASETPIRSWWR